MYLFYTLKVMHKKCMTYQTGGTVDVKWWVLEFGHLLSSTVKSRRLPQQEYLLRKPLSIGLWIAKLCAQVARNTCGQA
jgi:hypothetical protein